MNAKNETKGQTDSTCPLLLPYKIACFFSPTVLRMKLLPLLLPLFLVLCVHMAKGQNEEPPVEQLPFRKISEEENKELNRICGKPRPSPRFRSNGPYGFIDQFPWVAVAEMEDHARLCTFSLISRRHALTAAHCVVNKTSGKDWPVQSYWLNGPRWLAYGGDCHFPPDPHMIEENGCVVDTMKRTKIRTAIRNDQYPRHRNAISDIAIVELEKDISLDDFVPICMPTADSNSPSWGAMPGFGYTNRTDGSIGFQPHLRYVTGELIEVKEPDHYFLFDTTFTKNKATVMHGLVATVRASPFNGDSGAPIVGWLTDDTRAIQFAVISTIGVVASDCDVRRYADWICEMTGVCGVNWEKNDNEEQTASP